MLVPKVAQAESSHEMTKAMDIHSLGDDNGNQKQCVVAKVYLLNNAEPALLWRYLLHNAEPAMLTTHPSDHVLT